MITTEIKKTMSENLAINQNLENINKIILQATEKAIPLKDTSLTIHKKWITEETLELAKNKSEAKLRMRNSEEMAAKYKNLCNKVKASSRKVKQAWLEEQCT